MNIDKNEAALTLAAIDAADGAARNCSITGALRSFLILWGSIWLLANTGSDLALAHNPALSSWH